MDWIDLSMSGIICKVVVKRFWDGKQVDFTNEVRFMHDI